MKHRHVGEDERRQLVAAGYEIEDMGSTWGKAWEGNFRFMRYSADPSDPEDIADFGEPTTDENLAWLEAAQHHAQAERQLFWQHQGAI